MSAKEMVLIAFRCSKYITARTGLALSPIKTGLMAKAWMSK